MPTDTNLVALRNEALILFHLVCGRLVLHGAAVGQGTTAGGQVAAVAILGPSGAGKSTTTEQLLTRGWSPAADDVTVLDVDCASVNVLPTETRIRTVGADPAAQKASVIISPHQRLTEPAPLQAVMVLNADAARSQVSCKRLRGLRAISDTVPAWRVDRPTHPDSRGEVADLATSFLSA